jgi:hypothetical protein
VQHLLRVSVADRPGSLGALATALGEAGGDIRAIDVIERGPAGAVDDVLIDIDGEGSPQRIRDVLSRLPGVVVESLQPFTEGDQLGDPLNVVDALLATSSRALAAIIRMAPSIVRAQWVLVLDLADGAAATSQASAGAPWVRWARLPWLPLTSAKRIEADPSWVPYGWGDSAEMAAAPIGESNLALLVIRPNGPRFRGAEVAKLRNLAALAALLDDRDVRSSVRRIPATQ